FKLVDIRNNITFEGAISKNNADILPDFDIVELLAEQIIVSKQASHPVSPRAVELSDQIRFFRYECPIVLWLLDDLICQHTGHVYPPDQVAISIADRL